MKQITGHTGLTGLLGSPVAHSISPMMHNEAFEQLGLDYVYLAFDVIPGDAALAALGTDVEPERLAALREEMGLNRPFLERYFDWLVSFVRGDFGTSYKYKLPVADMIVSKLPVTVIMALISFAIMTVVSLPVGIYTAKHSGGRIDRVITVINQIMMSVPHFFMGIIITYVFGMVFKLFTPGVFVSYETDFVSFLSYIIFPFYVVFNTMSHYIIFSPG